MDRDESDDHNQDGERFNLFSKFVVNKLYNFTYYLCIFLKSVSNHVLSSQGNTWTLWILSNLCPYDGNEICI
jgi:hypothetical protein